MLAGLGVPLPFRLRDPHRWLHGFSGGGGTMPVGQADAAIALGCRHSPGSCSRWGGPGAEPKASGSAYCPVANSSAGRGHLPAGRMPLDNAGERGLSRSRARSRSGFGAEGLFPSRLGSPPLSVSQSTASPGACGRAEPPPGRGSQSPALASRPGIRALGA